MLLLVPALMLMTADYQISFVGPPGNGYIGCFYKNASRAERLAKRLRTNLRPTSGRPRAKRIHRTNHQWSVL